MCDQSGVRIKGSRGGKIYLVKTNKQIHILSLSLSLSRTHSHTHTRSHIPTVKRNTKIHSTDDGKTNSSKEINDDYGRKES